MNLILIVDDEHSIREGYQMILEKAGYQTILATNGIEALEQLKVHTIDLILSDGRMPQMTGFELLRQVRSRPAYASIPFIIASGERVADVLQNIGQKLAFSNLSKPVHPQELLQTVADLLATYH